MAERPELDLRGLAPAEVSGSGATLGGGADGASAAASTHALSESLLFKLRPVPILIAIAAIFGLWLVSLLIRELVGSNIRWAALHNGSLLSDFIQQIIQLLLAVLAIRYLRQRIPGDYGLQLPPGRSFVATAVILGVVFGLALALVDYGPHMLAHSAPRFDQPFRTTNIVAKLLYDGVLAGFSQEIPYRALLLTYLTAAMPGQVRGRGMEMNGAGIAIATILAAMEAPGAFIALNPFLAVTKVLCLFAFGVCYSYWFEKSRSVLAPIVGHNVTGLVEGSVLLAMVGAWR